MEVFKIIQKMINFSDGNLHDINHFMKVWAFAKTIGELENISSEMQFILELSAIIHDIACPLCREKYGNTNGKYQEIESESLVRKFLTDTDLTQKQIDRIVYLVSHHHTYKNIDGLDYQILIEADYLVNADESHYSKQNIKNTKNVIFKTKSGIELLEKMYGVNC